MSQLNTSKLFFISIFLGFSIFAPAFASERDGTIDSTNKYAWCNNTGWINFGDTDGNIHITDSGITGYAWDENYGWIKMNPANSGVTINSSGALSGKAWGENTGWIDFSGVSINCSGRFSGSATGDYVGTITFDCANCNVSTDYRPQSCGGGGGGPSLPLSASCSASPNPSPTNRPITFRSSASGGSFGFTYSWSGDCTGSDANCVKSFPEIGTYNTTVQVRSGSLTASAACSVAVDAIAPPPPPPLVISCAVSPNPALVGQSVSFNSRAYGGDGSYSYNWSGHCTGSNASCTRSFGASGTYTSTLTVTSSEETESATCFVNIIPAPVTPPPPLSVSCYASPNPALTSTNVIFNSSVTGGTGVYSYSWSGACTGENLSCVKSFPGSGAYTTTLIVTSGTQTKTAACSVNVNTVLYPPPDEPPVTPPITPPLTPPTPIIPPIIPPSVIIPIISPIISPFIPSETLPEFSDFWVKVITITGLTVYGLAIAFASPITFPELILLPLRLAGFTMIGFAWKKRNPPWGVVYDSITKQPLDPAYVILRDSSGKDVSSAITDLDGRYGFLIANGIYKIFANKTNYLFPSQKLAGKTNDELYDNLYFGQDIEVKKDGDVLTRNIPLDPLKFDWNEFTKQNKSLNKFYSRWDAMLREISDFFYVVGFFVSTIAFFVAPYPYNTIIMGVYLLLFILRLLGIKPRPYGSVIKKSDNSPFAFAIVRVSDPESQREISHRITDKYGRYFCLVPKGKYYIKIETKNTDGSYSLSYASQIIDATKNGIIKNRFKI